MPFGKKRTAKEKAELQTKIIALMFEGFNDNEIMEALSIPRTTFYSIAKKAREEAKERLWGDVNRIITNYAQRTEIRIHRAEKKAKKLSDPKWESIAQQADNALFDRLQSIGVVPKAVEKQEIRHSGIPLTEKETKELNEAYERAKRIHRAEEKSPSVDDN